MSESRETSGRLPANDSFKKNLHCDGCHQAGVVVGGFFCVVHLVVPLLGLLVVEGFFEVIHQGVSVVVGCDEGFCHQTVVVDEGVAVGGHQVVEVVGLFDHDGQAVEDIAGVLD